MVVDIGSYCCIAFVEKCIIQQFEKMSTFILLCFLPTDFVIESRKRNEVYYANYWSRY